MNSEEIKGNFDGRKVHCLWRPRPAAQHLTAHMRALLNASALNVVALPHRHAWLLHAWGPLPAGTLAAPRGTLYCHPQQSPMGPHLIKHATPGPLLRPSPAALARTAWTALQLL